jgi:hypothetical protein
MSARSAREGALTQAPSPKGTSQKQIRRYWLILYGKAMLSWLLVVLLLVGFEVGIRHVSPDAVQISQSSAATGHTLASREITDARNVADFYARINSLPVAPPGATFHCPLFDPKTVTQYTVRFTRWGLPVEVATLTQFGCLYWYISSGGVPGVFIHLDPDGRTQPILQVQP